MGKGARSMTAARGPGVALSGGVALILVAEDDPDVRTILADQFRRAGYEVVTAAHGAEAIERLSVLKPDAVFVDLLMPGVLGTSVLEFIATQRHLDGTPVAVVSATPELAPAGYTTFAKPARFATLLAFAQQHAAPTG